MSYAGHSLGDTIWLRSCIDGPDVPANSIQTGSNWITMKDKRTIAFVLHVNGAALGGTTPTITFVINQASSSSGTGDKAISGASIIKVNPLGLENDDDVMCIEVDVGSLDTENDFFWVIPKWTFSEITGSNFINVIAMAVVNRMDRGVNGIEAGVAIKTNYVKAS